MHTICRILQESLTTQCASHLVRGVAGQHVLQGLPSINRTQAKTPALRAAPTQVPARPPTVSGKPTRVQQRRKLGTRAIAGISVGVAGVVLCVGAAIVLSMRRCRRGGNPHPAKPHSAKPQLAAGPKQASGSPGHLLVDGIRLANAPSNSETSEPHTWQATQSLAHSPEAESGQRFVPSSPTKYCQSEVSARTSLVTATQAVTSSAEQATASVVSGVRSASTTTVSAARATCKTSWAAGVATRSHDTFVDMTEPLGPMTAPGSGANVEERWQFLHHQLDSLAGVEILQGLLLFEGSSSRHEGGAVLLLEHLCSHAVCQAST
jgi:hypothetical protein